MNRRGLLATSALIAPVIAVAACVTGAVVPAVLAVFNGIQFVMPLLDVLVAGMAIAVPAAAPLVAIVTPYLNSAAAVFADMVPTMTQLQALPLVQQIEGFLQSAVKAANDAVNAPGADPKLKQFLPKIAQAQQVLDLLTAFGKGVQGGTALAPMELPRLLHR
jgi:hypothetical protein